MRQFFGGLFSGFYYFLLLISQSLYRLCPAFIKKTNAKVISVGNITWGGTGKTPFVAMLAKHLSGYGKRVAILIRGYGDDEVKELKNALTNIPVFVGRDRVKSAKAAIKKYGSQILILDDGFQHLRLHRDLDIVTINATLPFGPGGLIPKGSLREPVGHLSRADMFVLTKADVGSKNLPWIRKKILAVKPNATILEAVHKPIQFIEIGSGRSRPLEDIKGKKVGVISAIEDPYSFEKTLEYLGAEIPLVARYTDHHQFSTKEVQAFIDDCRRIEVFEIITTGKDFYRLDPTLKKGGVKGLEDFKLYVLQIELKVSDEETLIRRSLNT